VLFRSDQLIHQHAPEWPLDQMAIIDHNILRMAIWEFAVGATPLKVAINEAVEMAKLFGADSAPRFVNGVLGALASREAELLNAFAAAALSAPEQPCG
jgi:N utilization substance protein B